MKADWTELQSKTIDALRFPMAVAVVILHNCKDLILHATGVTKALCIFFQEGICRLAVPCFFFISGYLFFNRLHEWSWSEWGRKLKNRGRTLLIPYILWNIIALVAYWAWYNLHTGPATLYQQFLASGGIRMFWSVSGLLPIGSQAYPIDGPLWFIRDLMFYILATPLIYLFIRRARIYGVVALGVVFLAFRRVVPEGLLFFIFGAFMQLTDRNVLKTAWPFRTRLLILTSLFLAATCYLNDISEYWCRFCKFFLIVFGIGAAFCLAAWNWECRSRLSTPFLVRSSFFIFAAHEILILQHVSRPLVASLVPAHTPWGHFIAFFLVPALAVAICLGLLFVLQKALPRLTGVLTGNRHLQPAKA